jgi:hypothetical protein
MGTISRVPERAIIAVAGFLALFVVLGFEGTWLVGDPHSGVGLRDAVPAHSDAMWKMLSRTP